MAINCILQPYRLAQIEIETTITQHGRRRRESDFVVLWRMERIDVWPEETKEPYDIGDVVWNVNESRSKLSGEILLLRLSWS